MRNFILELNHPFPNLSEIIESYRWIMLENLWTFANLPEGAKILKQLNDWFLQIYGQKMSGSLRDRHRQTLFNVLELLYKVLQKNETTIEIFELYLNTAISVLSDDSGDLKEVSSSLRKYVSEISTDPRFEAKIFDLLKRTFTFFESLSKTDKST